MAKGRQNTMKSNLLLQSCVVSFACLLYWSFGRSSRQNHVNIIQKNDVIHAISGAIGSALSITLLYPLETIRTRLQVDSSLAPRSSFLLVYNIGRKEGFQGLYKGWFSLVVALMTLNFVYFYFFRAFRRWVTKQFVASFNKIVIDLIVGYGAGVIAVLLTAPLWLVNTRLKLQGVNIGQAGYDESKKKTNQQYTGIFQCIYKIYNEEGVLTLWHGTFTSLILATNPAINLGVYMMLKRHHLLINAADTNIYEPFFNALLSKFVATVITYPIQVLQTRHRAGMKGKTNQSARKGGWFSLLLAMYRGLESKLLQTCLNSAFMFVIYERLVDILTSHNS